MSLAGADHAYRPARAGLARSGASRSAYVGAPAQPAAGLPIIWIDGILTGPGATRRVLIASLAIQDLLNETPNTCNFTVHGAKPLEGADIRIDLNDETIFAGSILRVTEVYVGQNPHNILWQVEGIDWTWKLNARLVSARYTATNAAAIAADLLARFAPPGYTLAVPEPLPDVDEISFTNTVLMEALAQLAQRIGGYASCGYDRVIALWLTESGALTLDLTPQHPSLEAISYTRDLSQVTTRALVEGGGVQAIADVDPGADRMPVADVGWYTPGGGLVVSGPQRIAYAGTEPGGAGAMIGTGAVAVPTTAPIASVAAGTGLPNGTFRYAYTWQTASGETTPSPIVPVTLAPVANPTQYGGTQVNYADAGGSLSIGQYNVSYVYAVDDVFPPTQYTTWQPAYQEVYLNDLPGNVTRKFQAAARSSSDPKVKWIYVIRTTANTLTYYLDGHKWANNPALPNHSVTAYQMIDGPSDGELMASYPEWSTKKANNTTGGGRITLSGINTGPSGTTGRRVYRTAVNAAQLKLHTTIANNTATAIAADVTADAALGANAPTTDTAGLVITTGVVLAGSPVIPVSSVGPFTPAGWAIVGGQTIRYSGVSATALTGVPATGPGSLEATVSHGTVITVAPQLIGIPAAGTAGAIGLPIKQGDPVNLVIVVDDLAAQAVLAALIGGDGVVEGVLTDNRITAAEAYSRGLALLAQKKDPQETIRFRVRDPLTKSGTTVSIDLPALGIVGRFKLQDVTIGGFLGTAAWPTYDAAASSSRFTFEDLLRQLRTAPRTLPV